MLYILIRFPFQYDLSHVVGVDGGVLQEDVETGTHLDPSLKEITYNPTYETMFAPEVRSVLVEFWLAVRSPVSFHTCDR